MRRSFGVLSEPRNRQPEDVIPLPQSQLFRNLFQRHGTATATITCSTGKKRLKTPVPTDALVTLMQLRCFSQRRKTLHTKHSVCLPTRAHAHARPRSHCLVNTSENTRGQNEDVGFIIYTSRVYATSPGLHRLFVLRKYYCHFIWALYNINLCV